MIIPKKFELGGIEWHVQQLMPPDSNMASCNQEIGVIHVKKQPNRSSMEQGLDVPPRIAIYAQSSSD